MNACMGDMRECHVEGGVGGDGCFDDCGDDLCDDLQMVMVFVVHDDDGGGGDVHVWSSGDAVRFCGIWRWGL